MLSLLLWSIANLAADKLIFDQKIPQIDTARPEVRQIHYNRPTLTQESLR